MSGWRCWRARTGWPRHGSGRWQPAVFTEIVIDHSAAFRHSVIEVWTKDRPGLLFTLAQALHELDISISLAKINTEGTRAIDVFYVTDLTGSKITSPARQAAIKRHILAIFDAGEDKKPSGRGGA